MRRLPSDAADEVRASVGRPFSRCATGLALALGPLLLLAPAASAQEAPGQLPGIQEVQPGEPPFDCAKCHSRREFLAGKTESPATDSALFVPRSVIQGSRHDTIACATCHPDQSTIYPHEAAPGVPRAIACESCHEAEGADWRASQHAVNVAEVGDAPTCVRCHGAHAIFGADDRRSPTHPFNVAELCGGCHADPAIVGTYFAQPERVEAKAPVVQYYKTVHGLALRRTGLVVSATCNDCHGAHKVLGADAPESSTNRDHMVETCGRCHVGIVEAYTESAHGVAVREGRQTPNGRSAPVCSDCHSSHEIVRADAEDWFVGVVQECGDCHEDLYDTYSETYHGKVTQLGYGLTAKCSDCHTPHAMLPPSDPRSSVNPRNLVATCGRCHEGANERFAEYYPHGDPSQRSKYPKLFGTRLFMTVLLLGVFGFFGVHTALWAVRMVIERRRRRGGKRNGRAEKEEPSGT
jgi:nitrate/TMAO reductase-like tetraheme cytochrome c subunit